MGLYDEQILMCEKYVEELDDICNKLYEFYDKYGEVSGEYSIKTAFDFVYHAKHEIGGVIGDMKTIENFEEYEDE